MNWSKYKFIYYKVFGVLMMFGWMALATLSTWQTILFFQSGARGTLATLAFISGAAMDFGQYSFPLVAEIKKHQGEKYRIYQAAMVICFIMSIITSVGVNLNESNYIKNNKGETVLKTQAGKVQSNVITAKSIEAATIQKQLDAKLASYESDKKAIQDKYADRLAIAQKKNYITTPDQNGYIVSVVGLKAKISSEIKELDNSIANLRAELKVANDKAISENDKLNTMAQGILPTEGAESFLAAMMKLTGVKDQEKVNIIFWILKEFIYQFFAILFSRGFYICLFCKGKEEDEEDLSPIPPDGGRKKKIGDTIDDIKGKVTDLMERKKQKDNPVTNSTLNNVIRFDRNLSPTPSPSMSKNNVKNGENFNGSKNQISHKRRMVRGITSKKSTYKISKFDQDVIDYMKVMEDTQKNDVPLGYQSILKILQKQDETWTEGRARAVFEHLKKVGVLKIVEGEGTKIVRKKKSRSL